MFFFMNVYLFVYLIFRLNFSYNSIYKIEIEIVLFKVIQLIRVILLR